jgi:hypothetical protein
VFQPTASDPNGNTLTFSITSKPSWASFNTSTGRLQGTPGANHVQTYSNIVIRVSDGQASAALPAFSITVTAVPNAAPTISGSPPTSVMQGAQYVFQPTANDADGDTLTFTIAGKPSWATFSTTTGRLAGTPGVGDIASYANIMIGVTDGAASAALPAFGIVVQAPVTGSATLSWTAPTQKDDGSPLDDLAGYKVYWGTSQGTYPNSADISNPGVTMYVVDDLAPGTYYFVTTAYDSADNESEYSNVASKTIQ